VPPKKSSLKKPDPSQMTDEQKAARLAELEALLAKVDDKLGQAKALDPFTYFEPNSGEITPDRRKFLEKWLKPDDVPTALDGQLDVLGSDADIIYASGGNQSSKTTSLILWALIGVTGIVPKALEGKIPEKKLPKKFPRWFRLVGVDHKTVLANLIPALQHWVPRKCLKNGKWSDSWSAERNTLFLYSSNKGDNLLGAIEIFTNQMDVESFQGPPRHGIGYDELPRRDIYKENLMRFTTADSVNIMIAATPTSGMATWVKDEIVDRAETESGSSIGLFKLVSVVNRKANIQVLEEILRGLDSYEEIKMRLLGEFVSLSGLVYGKLFSRKVHLIDPFDVRGDNYVVYRGLDPHLVKPSVCVELAVDREGNKYVTGCYAKDEDTAVIKKDLSLRAQERGYRLAQTRCDKSANSTIKALGDRNIFLELSRGADAIPAMVTSEKFTGSINAGVDAIKRDLRIDERTGKPKLFFFNIPENTLLIKAMETMERELATDEEKKGIRDKIAEGKWDHHAALRYIYQGPIHWIPTSEYVEPPMEDRYI
jgi:phage terminase large subunit-like protein